jgi:NAD-dependent dihydropyrimidine dehydrogenase PreA subunit
MTRVEPDDGFQWGPTLDAAACTDCRVCLEFCQQGVYGMVGEHVRVVGKDSCVDGCSHCASMCEAGALTFPTLDELRAAKRQD